MSDQRARDPQHVFRRRRAILILALLAVLALCVTLAVAVQREASERVRHLARVELEAARLAREFRSAIDDLHGALLRLGTSADSDSLVVITQRRRALEFWLKERQAQELTEEARGIVQRIATELRSYFARLDALTVRQGGAAEALDRETIVMFDDGAVRLQSLSEEFADSYSDELEGLMESSLASVLRMRNLIFGSLILTLAATGVAVWLLDRSIIRPLREQLVDRESLLAKREKLAALGTLAAGVAHEIRNPLTAIKARVYTLRRGVASDDSRADVQAISGEVERLEGIVREVLGYARPASAVLAPVELAGWLREFAAFVRPTIAGGIELQVQAPTTAEVLADENQLRQIVLNLVRNAHDAIEARGGCIELALAREHSTLHGIPTAIAVLAVTDDGPGIPAEVQARLFDPFFTTKAAGTGLGLSIVARLVENQGGEIAFQSAPGRGTRFAVRLPLREGAKQDPEP